METTRPFDRIMQAVALRPLPGYFSYPLAAAGIVIMALVRATLVTNQLPYLLFIPVIVLIALMLGRGPGLFATALGAAIAAFFFLPPFHSFALGASQLLSLGLFLLTQAIIVQLCFEVRLSLARRAGELRAMTEARDALAVTEAFMASVLSSSNDCIKVLDLDARLTFMSEGGKRVMEVTDFGLIQGCPWPDFWKGQGNAAAKAAVATAKAGGIGHFQGLADTMAGTPRWWDVLVTPILGPDGKPERLLSISRDVSEAKEVEQRLRLADERLQLALGASGMVGIWDWDLRSDLIHADANFARIYNVDPDHAAQGAPLADYTRTFHVDDLPAFQAELEALFAGSEGFSCEYRLLQPDGSVKWVLARGGLVRDADGTPLRFPGATVDITAIKQGEEQQQLLNHELAHRLKNTMAIIQAIVGQTLRQAKTMDEVRDALGARLAALGRAHDILVKSNWDDAEIGDVVTGALAPHSPGPQRLAIEGPRINMAARCGLGLSLALHELATNAAKYGALSVPEGCVNVTWSIDRNAEVPMFRMRWRESGGPPVTPPARRGFGSAMIERSLRGYFKGEAAIDFAPAGLVFRLDAPLAELGAGSRQPGAAAGSLAPNGLS